MASLAYKIVEDFEKTIAEYAGSKYAVAVESGTSALFLSLMYRKNHNQWFGLINIPKFTYPSVANSIIHAGSEIIWENKHWSGIYQLGVTDIWDAALRFKKAMYDKGPDALMCLSFHAKKLLPIGRGGMILLDDKDAYEWLKLARFDGREPAPLGPDTIKMVGYNMYMTPEQAARGLQLFDMIKTKDLPDLRVEDQGYVDLSKLGIYAQTS